MSGTSLDAVDAALVEFTIGQSPRLINACNTPIPDALRIAIEQICQPGDDEINRMGELDTALGELFANAALAVLENTDIGPQQVRAIGSHGQTIRHHPFRSKPFSVQIGDPNIIALRTRITTVADFRRMDIATGGQGAPLVPAFHDAILRSSDENRIIVNIGGMANITLLSRNMPTCGFDTGPGNVLMDGWIKKHKGLPHDENGNWARSGQCDDCLLNTLMAHPYIVMPAPKSTGREIFHPGWLESQLSASNTMKTEDIQRTLLEFTARSISLAIHQLPEQTDRVLLCGGGSHNRMLHERLETLLPGIPVNSTSDIGIPADWMEAMAFAWLAKQRIEGKPGNIPAVTGARHTCVLGGIYSPG